MAMTGGLTYYLNKKKVSERHIAVRSTHNKGFTIDHTFQSSLMASYIIPYNGPTGRRLFIDANNATMDVIFFQILNIFPYFGFQF